MKPAGRNIIRNALDQQLTAMKDLQSAVRRPSKGWLRAVRDGIGMTKSDVAKVLGVSRQAYSDLEAAEGTRAVTLKSLERAADAMECDVVYFLVPRAAAGGTFAALAQVHDPVFRQLQKTEHSMALEGQAVGDLPPMPKAK